MPTVLAYTSPALGHLFPLTPLLIELAVRGHDVHVRTLPEQVSMMRGLGFQADAIDTRCLQIEHHDYGARNAVAALSAAGDVCR